MKNNIENQFREALNDYELSYNPMAWSALSERLDKIEQNAKKQNDKQKQSSTSVVKKLIVLSSVAIVSAVIVYFLWTPNETINVISTKNNEKIKITTQHDDERNEIEQQKNTHKEFEQISYKKNTEAKNLNIRSSQQETIGEFEFVDIYPPINVEEKNTLIETKDGQIDKIVQPTYVISESENSRSNTFERLVSVNDPCQGDIVPITNTNNFSLLIVSPKNQRTTLKPKQSINYELQESGRYQLLAFYSDDRQKLTEYESFVVKERPSVNFSIDSENRFKDGIPSILLETQTIGKEFMWTFQHQSLVQHGRTAYAHFYKKGTYQVSLTVQHDNGCKTTTSKNIAIDKDYNLLAPTAFVPLSGDYRTNRFIPVALLHRKTAFTMQIIDPQRGVVIFQTSSTDGWDGVDSTTKQLVKENSYYIWKVQLSTPEPGEQHEYKGFVTRL